MPRRKTYVREEVLEKALLLFHEKGYEATGMRELEECMGISRSSIYDSFGDKDGLYKEALQLYQLRTSKELIRALEHTDDVILTLRTYLIDGLRQRCESGPKGCLIANTCTEVNVMQQNDVREFIISNHNGLVSALSDAIMRCQMVGKASCHINAAAAAELIIMAYNGASLINKAKENVQSTLDALELAISMLDVSHQGE